MPAPIQQVFLMIGGYSTWNPNDKSSQVTLSNNNLTWSNGNSSNQGVRSTIPRQAGLLYFEYTILNTGGGRNDCGSGIAARSFVFTDGNANNAFVQFNGSGNIWFNGASTGKTLGARSNNDIICVAVDFTNLRAWMRANAGNWNGDAAANPATNTNGIDISAVFSSSVPAFALGINNATINATVGTLNAGRSAFSQAIPSGFVSWDQVPQSSTIITAAGAGTFTVPTGVTSVTCEAWGAGGGGSGVASSTAPGGGGGGYSKFTATGLTPGGTIFYSVGTHGSGAFGVATSGTASWVNPSANSQPSSNGCVGNGGAAASSGHPAGGTGTIGTTNHTGGNGGGGTGTPTAIGGGGGGGAGSGGNGGNGADGVAPFAAGGTAGTPDGGAGGNGVLNVPGVGQQPAGGGGGSWGNTGADGADGQVRFTW